MMPVLGNPLLIMVLKLRIITNSQVNLQRKYVLMETQAVSEIDIIPPRHPDYFNNPLYKSRTNFGKTGLIEVIGLTHIIVCTVRGMYLEANYLQ